MNATRRGLLKIGFSFAVSLVASGCDAPTSVEPDPPPVLRLSVEQLELSIGDTAAIDAMVTDSAGVELGASLKFSSENTSIATVDSAGVVTARSAGITAITVRVNGHPVQRNLAVLVSSPRGPSLVLDSPQFVRVAGKFYRLRGEASGSIDSVTITRNGNRRRIAGASESLFISELLELSVGRTDVEVGVFGSNGGASFRRMVVERLGYRLVPLGTLEGGASEALDLNSHNEVVGRALNAEGRWVPMLWREGSATVLDTLPTPQRPRYYLFELPDSAHSANSINDSGQIAGFSSRTAAYWGGRGVPEVSFGYNSWAYDINNRGTIGGGSPCNGSVCGTAGFLVSPDGSAWLSHPNRRGYGVIRAVNDLGVAVGSPNFRWVNGSPTTIGFEPYDINDSETIVGVGYILRDSIQTELAGGCGNLGSCTKTALAVNESDVAVGYARSISGGADDIGYLWENGLRTSLSDLSSPGWRILRGTGINDRGSISAIAINPSTGQREAVLMVAQVAATDG